MRRSSLETGARTRRASGMKNGAITDSASTSTSVCNSTTWPHIAQTVRARMA